MNRLALFAIFVCMVLVSTYSAEAQNPAAAFSSNLRSGALGGAMSDLLKNTVLLPYTTVGGELDPQYKTQRQIIDLILFFVIFIFAANTGLSNVWKDAHKGQKMGAAIAIAIVLDLALVGSGFSLGQIVPYGKGILLLAFAVVIFILLQIPRNKEGKPKINAVTAVILAVAISWLLINSLTLFEGKTPTIAGGLFNTEKKSDFSARIISSRGSLETEDPGENYRLALESVQSFDYENAKLYFEKIVRFASPASKEYKETVKFITIKGGDKLFQHMARNYPKIMDAEREAANILLDKAEKLTAQDDKTKAKRNELIDQAEAYANSISDKQKLLETELKERGVKL